MRRSGGFAYGDHLAHAFEEPFELGHAFARSDELASAVVLADEPFGPTQVIGPALIVAAAMVGVLPAVGRRRA